MKKTSHPGFELWTPADVVRIMSLDHQSRYKCSHMSILVPFRTNKDSFLPVTFTGLADLFPQLGSWLQQLCGNFMYLALVVQCLKTYNCCKGSRVKILGETFYIFSCWHPWKTRFQSSFHISFWDFICGIKNWGMASFFWNHVIQISISKNLYWKHLLLIIKYLLLRNSFVSSVWILLMFDTD